MKIEYVTRETDKKRFAKISISDANIAQFRVELKASKLDKVEELSPDSIYAMRMYFLVMNSLSPEQQESFLGLMEDSRHLGREKWYSSESDDD